MPLRNKTIRWHTHTQFLNNWLAESHLFTSTDQRWDNSSSHIHTSGRNKQTNSQHWLKFTYDNFFTQDCGSWWFMYHNCALVQTTPYLERIFLSSFKFLKDLNNFFEWLVINEAWINYIKSASIVFEFQNLKIETASVCFSLLSFSSSLLKPWFYIYI